MTRFLIKLDEAVKFVWHAFTDMNGGEIYIKKIPSIEIVDLAKAIDSKKKIKFVGVRPGEKLHEEMINYEDSSYTYEYINYYKILPQLNKAYQDKKRIKNGKKVKEGFVYRSDKNIWWVKEKELKKLLINFVNG
jgi:FlaA1/EpsC-like NDP-sugar epimerase